VPVQRVLSNDLWTEVRKQARASQLRKGAIAYVTRDLIGFRKGDTLVVDASSLAIRNGETDASLLRKLHTKGVQVYDCNDLHARIAELGNRTWIIGVHELKQDPNPEEERLIDHATRSLQERLDTDDEDFSWIRWGARGRFPRECREGDLLIQMWRSSITAKRPSEVWKAVPVLLKQSTKGWTRFYVAEPSGRSPEITWGQFQRLLRQVSYPRQIKARSVHLVEPDIADTISRMWNSAARG
jgi:hypothetical protein